MSFRSCTRLSLFGLMASSVVPVWAQTSTAEPAAEAGVSGATALPDIIVRERAHEVGYQPKRATTATRTDAALRDVPQAIAVVPAQVLQDQLVRSIDEALYYVSGITQANTLGGTQDAVVKRGFGANRDGSILRDGVRTVLARNLTFTTDRVEVIKGPSSVLYGAMEPGGMVNMVTKKPQLSFAGQAALYASSFGGGGASADITGPIGDNGLAYRMIVDASRVDYWRNFGVNKQTVVAPSLAWYGRDTYVRVSYEHTEYEQPFDRGTVLDSRTGKPVDVDPKRRFDEAYNRTIGDSDFFTVQAQHALNTAWKLNGTYSYNRNRYSDYQARPVSLNPVTGILTRRPDGTRGAESQMHVAQVNLQGQVNWAGLQHEILVGLDAENSDIFRRDLIRGSNVGGFNIYNPVYGVLPNSTTVDPATSDQSDKIEQQALFVQDAIRLNDQWLVNLGARWQRYDQVAGRGRPFVVGSSSDGTAFVPRAGVVWQPNAVWSLYANYAESLNPQSSIGNVIGTLPPEEAKSLEFGAKLELPRGVTATAAVYDIDKRNVVVRETIGGQVFARAVGGARSRGLEVDVAGQVGRHWKLIGNLAYTDAEVTDDPVFKGKQLPNVARVSGGVFATYEFPRLASGLWRAGAGVRHVGRRPGDSNNSFFNDSYEVADAFVSWDTAWSGRAVRMQLNVKNLFDKTYVSSSTNTVYMSFGEARQVVARVVVDF
ncbi:MAG: TonB-dependent siderophore receptor [Aquabacterium sp.]|jgi:iron complex outermembrane recepter protein|uniref:TonB-dependent siderophore receptor n=1 Tax=Aquabacterium sp. TaxID=1872578 RepID=UPI003BB078A2